MNPYDPTIFDRAIAAAQAEPSAVLHGLTVRDEANALVAGAIRNDALFEQLHAGKNVPEVQEPDVSRISDAEMKQLMIRFSAKVAWLLHLRDARPDEYARQIDFFRRYTGNWEGPRKIDLRFWRWAKGSGRAERTVSAGDQRLDPDRTANFSRRSRLLASVGRTSVPRRTEPGTLTRTATGAARAV